MTFTPEEIAAMAKEAGFIVGVLDTLGGSRPLVKHSGFDCYAELLKFACLLSDRSAEPAQTGFSKFELVHMASQAGMVPISYNKTSFDTEQSAYTPDLARFAALVAEKAAAKERDCILSNVRPVVVEALCSATGCPDLKGLDGRYLVAAIEELMAAAIRARGQKGGA